MIFVYMGAAFIFWAVYTAFVCTFGLYLPTVALLTFVLAVCGLISVYYMAKGDN